MEKEILNPGKYVTHLYDIPEGNFMVSLPMNHLEIERNNIMIHLSNQLDYLIKLVEKGGLSG